MKSSPKAGLYVWLCAAGIMILGACVQPVNISVFLEDEKVQDFVETIQDTVNLIDRTGDNLKEGNKRITGLKTDKYYMVRELSETEVQLNFGYVGADGAVKPALSGISRVSGGQIVNLTNNNTYVVYAAAPLSGNVEWLDLPAEPTFADTGTTVPLANGILNLPAPKKNYYLDLIAIIATITPLDKVRVRTSPLSTSPLNLTSSGNLIVLEGEDTETDYIFSNYDSDGNTKDNGLGTLFSFLRVKIAKKVPLIIGVTIDFNPTTGDPVFNPNPNPFTFSQDDFGSWPNLDVTITNAGLFNSISWQYNNNLPEVVSGGTVSINLNTIITNGITGTHVICVMAETTGGIFYSAEISVKID